MSRRISNQSRPRAALQDAVLDEARERIVKLHHPEHAGERTDESVTPPHGDPIGDLVEREPNEAGSDDTMRRDEDEGPGPAEGRTDNRAGG